MWGKTSLKVGLKKQRLSATHTDRTCACLNINIAKIRKNVDMSRRVMKFGESKSNMITCAELKAETTLHNLGLTSTEKHAKLPLLLYSVIHTKTTFKIQSRNYIYNPQKTRKGILSCPISFF